MGSGEPKILTGIYDLVNWYMSRTERFPKPLRVTLGDRIDTKLLGILELTVQARYARNPRRYLSALNMELETLRYLSRLALDRGGLQMKQFEYVVRSLNEVGRQVGGWLKQTVQNQDENSKKPVSASLGF